MGGGGGEHPYVRLSSCFVNSQPSGKKTMSTHTLAFCAVYTVNLVEWLLGGGGGRWKGGGGSTFMSDFHHAL